MGECDSIHYTHGLQSQGLPGPAKRSQELELGSNGYGDIRGAAEVQKRGPDRTGKEMGFCLSGMGSL